MAVFRAFKPEAMNKIAKSMGYTGNMAQFQDFIEQDPARKARMQQFTNAAVQMAKGGVVKMREGGILPEVTANTPGAVTSIFENRTPAPQKQPETVQEATVQRMYQPGLPQGGVTQAAMTPTGPGQEVQQGTGELVGSVAVPTAMAVTTQAAPVQEKQAAQVEAAHAAP